VTSPRVKEFKSMPCLIYQSVKVHLQFEKHMPLLTGSKSLQLSARKKIINSLVRSIYI
jgi:hypothetical protein